MSYREAVKNVEIASKEVHPSFLIEYFDSWHAEEKSKLFFLLSARKKEVI